MRIPIAANLESRDGALTKDAKTINGLIEVSGGSKKLRKRPGIFDLGLVKAGTAQLLTSWNGIKSVIADFWNTGTIVADVYTPSTVTSYTNSTAWNPADKSVNITLSGSDLIATCATAGTFGVRSVATKSSGFWYYEATISIWAGQITVGFADGGGTVDAPLKKCVAYLRQVDDAQSIIGGNGEIVSFTQTIVVTDKVGVLIDITNGRFSVFINGVFKGAVATIPATPVHAYFQSIDGVNKQITANFAGAFTYDPSRPSVTLSPTTASQMFTSSANAAIGSFQYLMIKNATQAWYIGVSGYYVLISDTDYPSNQTPALSTVPGVVLLDGYFFVMTTQAVIYNSELDTPLTWNPLGFVAARFENGQGVALAKTLEYVAAFKEFDVELFYNAANPVGSPLTAVPNGTFEIGCASGTSVVESDDQVLWMGQSKKAGRGIYAMRGVQHQLISTPDVDRILAADSLATVHAFAVKLDGHSLYVLTLVASNVTLVYDLTSQQWGTWSSLTVGSTIGGTITITRSGTIATYTSTVAHGMSDGDPVLISGCTQSDYNGVFQTSYVSAYSFTFQVANSPATPATGSPVVKPYTETYFKFTKYTNHGGLNLFLHESDGHLYKTLSTLYRDNGIPINFMGRTIQLDGQTLSLKKLSRLKIVGNAFADNIMVRYSDDDYVTNSTYRPVDMSSERPNIRRLGSFRQRSLEFKHTGNTLPILDAYELEIGE